MAGGDPDPAMQRLVSPSYVLVSSTCPNGGVEIAGSCDCPTGAAVSEDGVRFGGCSAVGQVGDGGGRGGLTEQAQLAVQWLHELLRVAGRLAAQAAARVAATVTCGCPMCL